MIEYTVRVDEYSTRWYLDGKRHRVDGPAVERANGTKYWYLNGKRHRVDGPAIEHADGYKSWWLDGEYLYEEYLSEAEFKRRTQVKELTIAQLEELLGYKIKVVDKSIE